MCHKTAPVPLKVSSARPQPFFTFFCRNALFPGPQPLEIRRWHLVNTGNMTHPELIFAKCRQNRQRKSCFKKENQIPVSAGEGL